MGQLGSLASLSSGGAGSLLKNPADIYVAILQSRTIGDHVINQFPSSISMEREKAGRHT